MNKHIVLDFKQNLITVSSKIENSIKYLANENPGYCAQLIIGDCRDLTDAIFQLEYSLNNPTIDMSSVPPLEYLKSAQAYCGNREGFSKITKLSKYTYIVTSHQPQQEFQSMILLNEYLELLEACRELCKKKYQIDILNNLHDFPFSHKREQYNEYYNSILENINSQKTLLSSDIFYIEKKRLIITDKGKLFEYVLAPISNEKSKLDRLTVYSLRNINETHSISCTLAYCYVKIFDSKLKVFYINDYTNRILARDLNLFAKLCGKKYKISKISCGYVQLMNYLTKENTTIYEIVNDKNFPLLIKRIFNGEENLITSLLSDIRVAIGSNVLGCKTLKYVLYKFDYDLMRSVSVKKIFDKSLNDHFPYLSSSCFPFEQNPFVFPLRDDNTSLRDLINCLEEYYSEEYYLKRLVKSSIENDRELYSPVEKFKFGKNTIIDLVNKYNSSLSQYFVNKGEELALIDNRYLTIKSYEENVSFIINKLNSLYRSKNNDYATLSENYVNHLDENVVDKDKINFIKKGFKDSSVLIINGSAGTGKTTLVKHFVSILSGCKFLFLSVMHSALINLKNKVISSINPNDASFLTLDYAVKTDLSMYDCLIIDECSTAPNNLIKEILSKTSFKYVILVGDETQIQSIKFGNWFTIALEMFPNITSNLSTIHRSEDKNLLNLWGKVRNLDNELIEFMSNMPGLLNDINNLFKDNFDKDEVVLCLNYDGPYGINSINRTLQDKNQNIPYSWNVWTFKKNDPIIFNSCYKYRKFFYNNQKGLIVDITENNNSLVFQIAIKKEDSNCRYSSGNVVYLGEFNGCDLYSIQIDKSTPDDSDTPDNSIVPFQLRYAISIHKSQGLEFKKVKIILTEDVDELITHNIFYTAITRAKERLFIYSNKNSIRTVVNSFAKTNAMKDISILRKRNKLI